MLLHFTSALIIESCSGAGATGSGLHGSRGGGYRAYGESEVSGTELHMVIAGRGHAVNRREVMLPEDSNSESAVASLH